MTTGRINQVTTSKTVSLQETSGQTGCQLPQEATVPSREFVKPKLIVIVSECSVRQIFAKLLIRAEPTLQTALFLDLTYFRCTSACPKRTHLVTFRENYQSPAAQRAAQQRRILNCLVASRFSHRQEIHSLQTLRIERAIRLSEEQAKAW